MITGEGRLRGTLAPSGPDAMELQSTRMEVSRLVVLVPDHDTYGIELARRVWALAEPCGLEVLFLCVPGPSASQESAIQLRLITLASQVRSERVPVDTRIESGVSWSAAVSRHWRPGDLVLCCAEQTVQTRERGMQPLWRVLECALGTPVFVLTGLYAEQAAGAPDPLESLRPLVRWVILLLIIGVFLVAEVRVDSVTTGLSHTLALIAMGLAELGLIALWCLST